MCYAIRYQDEKLHRPIEVGMEVVDINNWPFKPIQGFYKLPTDYFYITHNGWRVKASRYQYVMITECAFELVLYPQILSNDHLINLEDLL